MQVLEFGPGLDAKLVDEHPAHPVIGGQRVRLVAAPVQGEHQVGVQPLAQRELRDQRLQLRDRLRVPAQVQLRFQAPFHRLQTQLLQARYLAAP